MMLKSGVYGETRPMLHAGVGLCRVHIIYWGKLFFAVFYNYTGNIKMYQLFCKKTAACGLVQ